MHSSEPQASPFTRHQSKLRKTLLVPWGSWWNLKRENFIEVGASPETCKLHVAVNQSDCANMIRIPTKLRPTKQLTEGDHRADSTYHWSCTLSRKIITAVVQTLATNKGFQWLIAIVFLQLNIYVPCIFWSSMAPHVYNNVPCLIKYLCCKRIKYLL